MGTPLYSIFGCFLCIMYTFCKQFFLVCLPCYTEGSWSGDRSGHLNLKFMFPRCQLSGKKNKDAFSFILDKLKNCWRFLEMLVKKQQSRHVVLRGPLGETECICTTALDSALYQMLYLASLRAQKMNSFKTLIAIQVRCANVSKSPLTQLFPQKVPGRLAGIFSTLCIYALTFIAISVHYVKR